MNTRTEKRLKVAVVLGSEPDFDEWAFKYFILQLNKLQSLYEFSFPLIKQLPFTGTEDNNDRLFETFSNIKPDIIVSDNRTGYDYFIVIISFPLRQNLFCDFKDNVAIITAAAWDKYFAPPSVFEYLLQTVIASLLFMYPEIDLSAHDETYGCVFDYTRSKNDIRVGLGLGYICDDCKEIITKTVGNDIFQEIADIISLKWIGNINTYDTVAYTLKRYYRFDIDRDSGFHKTYWEKAKEMFIEKGISTLIGMILGALGALFTKK